MTRSILQITGDDRVPFLQGILTQDVTRLAADKIQFAALLSPQGKILHDMFLLDAGDAILLDTAAAFAPTLVKRLSLYKLRAKVEIAPFHGEMSRFADLPDPRLPGLPHYAPLTTHHPLQLPLLGRDFAPDTLTALDAGYDLLNGVSFTKGCYVGQEITARMHYKSIARRGWFLLERAGEQPHLENLKFDTVFTDASQLATHDSRFTVFVDNLEYTATPPPWMAPKIAAYRAGLEKQP